jgi:hypothetical protein
MTGAGKQQIPHFFLLAPLRGLLKEDGNGYFFIPGRERLG